MPASIVIGAGWAGLMCAYTLTKRGHDVTLIEAAPQVGGRARSIDFSSYVVDNGQHVCLGAYHTLRNLLKELNLDEKALFNILPMQLFISNQTAMQIRFPKLPAPYSIIFGLIFAKNLPWAAKFAALRFCKQVKQIKFRLPQDLPLLQLLKNYHQSDFVIQHLWEPIALATMTTPIKIASAQVFLNVLQRSFDDGITDSNWYIPKTDLSAVLPNHLEQNLLRDGCRIIKSQAIKSMQLSGNFCTSIRSSSQEWSADHIIVATPSWTTAALCSPFDQLQATSSALQHFVPQPIITIYFEFSDRVALPYPIVGMLNSICQWAFDRGGMGQPNIISAIISGPGAHQQLDHAQLANAVLQELRSRFQHLKDLIKYKVINDKKSAFSCEYSNQSLRPQPQTAIRNLWLAGDYVQTGLPATLEGALMSGKQTGELIASG